MTALFEQVGGVVRAADFDRIAPKTPSIHKPFTLRPFQAEDVDAVMDAWRMGRRAVICCWATGMGKSIFFAELSRRVIHGRVLVVVDTTKLAMDLYKTIIRHHGAVPGILTGDLKSNWTTARVVVATIQSLYAGKRNEETYRALDPKTFAAVLVDETESALADRFGATMLYFLDGNPNLKLAGASATPFRSDGRDMGELFDHCAPRDPQTGRPMIGVLNRNLKWGVLNGWIVKPRQAFLTCNVDFSTIKIRKRKDGERDWSDDDIAELLRNQDEQEFRRMAEGIAEMAGDKQSVVVCPDVDICKKVAGHICGAMGDNGAALAVYGEQGNYGRDLMDAHARGEYQHLVTCKMAEKGYDNANCTYAFMLRKTRSRRMYEQIMGRTCRPLVEIREALANAESAEERLAIIANSSKPWSAMVDLVGVHPDAKDMGVIDIIGDYLPDELRRRTMELMHERGINEESDEDLALDVGEVARDAVKQLNEEKRLAEERERERRSMVQVGRKSVNIEWDTDGQYMIGDGLKIKRGSSTPKQIQLMLALGISAEKAFSASKVKASKIIEKLTTVGKKPDWSKVRQFERQTGFDFRKGAA